MRRLTFACAAMASCMSHSLLAQESGSAKEGPDVAESDAPQPEGGVLDLTLHDNGEMDSFDLEHCEEEQDAASISRTIIVCRKRNDAAVSGFDKQKWEREYAKRTQGAKPVDVAGEGITGKHAPGGGKIVRGCLPGLQKCPPPPALIIDVTALPQAPAGSDADRIARGLPPLGNDGRKPIATSLEELEKESEPSPEESAEQAGQL